VLLYGSSNRLYYYVDYRHRDIVGDTGYGVNALIYICTLNHSTYMYSYIDYHSTVPHGTVASSRITMLNRASIYSILIESVWA
jgi:hypothetical protein